MLAAEVRRSLVSALLRLRAAPVDTLRRKYAMDREQRHARLARGHDDLGPSTKPPKSWKKVVTLQGHSGVVNSVVWSPDGNYIASGSMDGIIKVWSFETGACTQTLEGHSFYSGGVRSVAWSPDGSKVASGSGNNTVKVWSAETGARGTPIG